MSTLSTHEQAVRAWFAEASAPSTFWPGRWFCPVCERILKRPPVLKSGDRFHSRRCREPMRRVDVRIYAEVDQ